MKMDKDEKWLVSHLLLDKQIKELVSIKKTKMYMTFIGDGWELTVPIARIKESLGGK